ncbi:hypothetical protein V5799_031443 [Amblyomma americanum]|uniref:Uncharacterized protein n=1 Tax=Amblyomma americanum TaxID=6943 RepID=A0AAQ4EKM3_AMBAM
MQLRLPEDPPDEFERRSSFGRARKARYPDKSWKEKAKARHPDSMIQTLVSNSPPGPPPILEGEQVRNMPRPQAYPVPVAFIFDFAKRRNFDESQLTTTDISTQFTRFAIVLAALLTTVLGYVAYNYTQDTFPEFSSIPSTTIPVPVNASNVSQVKVPP